MNTVFTLMAEFETGDIPLRNVAQNYLGMTYKTACERASNQTLPFPVFRCGSQRSPWLVSVLELARWLDREKEKGLDEWKRINAA